MLKVSMHTPDRDSEFQLAQRMLGTNSPEEALAAGVVEPVITAEDLATLRQSLEGITVRDELIAYVVDVVRATRQRTTASSSVPARAPRNPSSSPAAPPPPSAVATSSPPTT